MLLRSWNLFHGNAVPPEREAFLEEMVRLVTGDEPDLVCLQEVPLWAFAELARWSAMQMLADGAAPARLGPLPSTARIGKALTSLHHGRLRSLFAGQGNAILAAPALHLLERRLLVLNERRFRRAQARWLGLGAVARAAWGKERRVCQAARLRRPGGRTLVLANLHATSYPPDERIADAEVFRAVVFADGLAAPDELVIVAGDLNVFAHSSRTLADVVGPEWGFRRFGHRVDHVLVRGADIVRGAVWPRARRQRAGRLLSDHAPIEVVVE